MNKGFEQSVIEWGKSAIRKAESGKFDSMHIDMFPPHSYNPNTAIEDCFFLMDRLVEYFAEDEALLKVVIMAAIELSCKEKMTIDVPDISSLKKERSNTPPEIYFIPRSDMNDLCDGEEYSRAIEIRIPMSNKYDRKNLFSFYKCWRGRRAIDNEWNEYERCIFIYFDMSGKLLWQS